MQKAHVLAIVLTLSGSIANAQTPATANVRVQVVDSAGRAVPGVDLSIVNGIASVASRGQTDSLGIRTLSAPAAGDYQITARRLGFLPYALFAKLSAGTQALRVTLAATPVTLKGETVTAERNRAYYKVGADDIAQSDRTLFDALDVLMKLRPEMIDARTPTTTIGRRVLDACYIQNIWVNGERVTFATVNERDLMTQRQTIEAIRLRRPISAGASKSPGGPIGLASVPLTVQSVLSSIQPEHIDEIRRTDCTDATGDHPHMRNAIFVSLKAGVKFEAGIGSYVSESSLDLAANRNRILGLFDEKSGAPIADASITDVASGSSIATSETGTSTLAFLSDGEHALRIRKKGYRDEIVHVTMSAAELTPLTIVLKASSSM